MGAFAGGTLVVSTSQKYPWTSTALTVGEMILVHYTCNVCLHVKFILFFFNLQIHVHVSHDTFCMSVKIWSVLFQFFSSRPITHVCVSRYLLYVGQN